MRVIVLVYPGNPNAYEAGEMPSPELLETMGKFNEELAEAGVMIGGEGLRPTTSATRLEFMGSEVPRVTSGPFSGNQRSVGGFWLWNVDSQEEAIEWAKRAPMEDGATLEVRRLYESSDFGKDVGEQEMQLRKKINDCHGDRC